MARTRRPGSTQRVRVEEWNGESVTRHEDRLATEEPLEMRVQERGSPARRFGITMRTPGHDFELAAGLMAAEGVVAGIDDIDTVAYCTDVTLRPEQEHNVVTVSLTGSARRGWAARQMGATSACGVCGSDSLDAVKGLAAGAGRRAYAQGPIPRDLLLSLPARLRRHQRLFDSTGGVHAAGIFDTEGAAVVVREDVGRHHAVDKAVGHCLLQHIDPAGTVLCTSGRLGFEIVQKAAVAGIGTVVAVGAPTSLAVDLAARTAMTVVGFVRGDRMVVYSGGVKVNTSP